MSVCFLVSILKFSSETILKALRSQTHVVCAADPCLRLPFPGRIPLQVVYCEVRATSVREWGSGTRHTGPWRALPSKGPRAVIAA